MNWKNQRHLYTQVRIILSLRIIDLLFVQNFERVYNDQMGVYFKDVLSTLLSAFRKRHGCHHVLTKLMENSKQALDEGKNVGLILLDLNKAFDCLPHRTLLCKLNAYGISYEACSLIRSYYVNACNE